MCDKWDSRFLKIAEEVKTWSKDRTQIGAVIIGDRRQILSTGYNGFPRKLNDKIDRISDASTKYKFTIHAEANAIFNAQLNNTDIKGGTIYISGLPCCHNCALAIIQSEISTVVMDTPINDNTSDKWSESGDLALQMFEEANINVRIKL